MLQRLKRHRRWLIPLVLAAPLLAGKTTTTTLDQVIINFGDGVTINPKG